jgi:hypothetical protein
MKNLNLFLWIFTTVIATFFAYHTYTHTRIRYKDLESVMQQNLVVEKGVKISNRETKKVYGNGIELTEMQGRSPKDLAILNKAKTIKNHTDSLLQLIDSLIFITENTKTDEKISLKVENITLLNEYAINYPQFVAKQDSALLGIKREVISTFDTKTYYLPFIKQNNLHVGYCYKRINYKSIDKLIARIGGVGFRCYFKIPILGVAKSYIVKSGNIYEASVFITDYRTSCYPEMQISEGIIGVKGDVGEIEIKNVKAQNYNREGKATKTLTGKITIMKADGSDTTFTLSTNYTVKKK